MLGKFRRYLHHRILIKKLQKENTRHRIVNLDQAKSIGILCMADPQIPGPAENLIKKLRAEDKSVEILAYSDRKENKNNPTSSVNYFSRSDIDFFLQPKKGSARAFITQPFDILINSYTDDCLPLEYISSLSPARFRIGPYKKDKTYYCDFMLNAENGSKDLQLLLDQIRHYLYLINKKDGKT